MSTGHICVLKDFTAKIKGKYVDSATLTMYETGSSQSGQTIEARRVTENWTRSGLKWSNRPGYSTNYGNVKTTGTAKKARSINLTEYARQCASGKITSYGVMLKNADETKELWTVLQFQSIIKPSKDVSDLL